MESQEYEFILQQIARAIVNDRCVLFLGPACSETAELRNQLGMGSRIGQTQRELVCELAKELGDSELQKQIDAVCGDCPNCRRCMLPEVAQQYEEIHGREKLRSFTAGLLKEGTPREFHSQLWSLPFSTIYTVNYDSLIIKARDGAAGVVTQDKVFATSSRPVDGDKIVFYKLHGSVDADDVVITYDDQDRLRLVINKEESALWHCLSMDLESKTFLYIGYALGDTYVLDIVKSIHKRSEKCLPLKSYAVIDKPMPLSAEREMKKFGIQTIHRSTDEFFRDLIEKYKYWRLQWSKSQTSTALNQRHPTTWDEFLRLLQDEGSSGLCLFGRGESKNRDDIVPAELRQIPIEMYDECKRRQQKGEKLLCILLDLAQLGGDVFVDPKRSVRLLENLVRQIDNQRIEIGLPSLDLGDKLSSDVDGLWEQEAEQRVNAYWTRVYSDREKTERSALVGSAVKDPTMEQQEENRRITERYLAGQISDWLDWQLLDALDGYRMIVMITDFQIIEPDEDWFTLVNQHFLNVLCKYNVGIIITRQASKKFEASRRFASYTLNLFKQIDLSKLCGGGY